MSLSAAVFNFLHVFKPPSPRQFPFWCLISLLSPQSPEGANLFGNTWSSFLWKSCNGDKGYKTIYWKEGIYVMVRKALRKHRIKFGISHTRSLIVHSRVFLLSLKRHHSGWLWLTVTVIFRVFNSHMPRLYMLFYLKCMVLVQSSDTVSEVWGSKMKLSTIVLKGNCSSLSMAE